MPCMIGNTNATRKLTRDDVTLIRELYKGVHVGQNQYTPHKITLKDIAAKFNVHPHTITKVVTYETWRHVR